MTGGRNTEAHQAIRQKLSDRELLIRIDERVEKLQKEFSEIKKSVVYGDTCKAHRNGVHNKIKVTDKRVNKIETDTEKDKRFTITAVIAVIAILVAAAAAAASYIGG